MEYAPIFALVIVIIGWCVTNHQNNQREERKEIKAAVDALVKIIDSTTILAIEYYSNDGDARKKARSQLIPMFARIETKIDVLQIYANIPEITSDFGLFFEAITNGDFDSSFLQPLARDHKRIDEILGAAESFVWIAESWFGKKYSKKYNKLIITCKKIDMRGY